MIFGIPPTFVPLITLTRSQRQAGTDRSFALFSLRVHTSAAVTWHSRSKLRTSTGMCSMISNAQSQMHID